MSEPRGFHRRSTRIFSILMVVIGLVIVIRTIAAGGGALAAGVLLGLLFIAAGAARLYLQLRAQ